MSTFEVLLRPRVGADQAFLRALFGTTRAAEVALLPWDQAGIERFLDQQFFAQHNHYQAQFPDACFHIIEASSQPIGRAYLHWTESCLRIIEMTLLPAWQGQGIGTRLLECWLAQADQQGLDAELQVTSHNPALRLYRRIGFQVVGENGPYLRMQRANPFPRASRPALQCDTGEQL